MTTVRINQLPDAGTILGTEYLVLDQPDGVGGYVTVKLSYSAAFDTKADSLHSHSIGDVEELSDLLAAKADTVHNHPTATASTPGFMSAAHWSKLQGIAAGADVSPVQSVNGQTGTVALTATDVGAAASAHTHTPASIGAAPATHTHAISNVTGLSDALNGKASSTHTHAISNVTGLSDALNGKAASVHTHEISNVTGLSDALNGKAASVHAHEINDVSGLTTALGSKASVSSATPQALGTASAGASTDAARADHVHAMPSAANVGAVPMPGSNGIVVRTGASSAVSRTLAGTTDQIVVTNGDGVSGAPTFSLAGAVTASLGLADSAVQPARQVNSGTGLTGGGDLSANRTLALTGQALALHNLATSGFIVRTGAGAVAARTLTAGQGAFITNGNGISDNPTISVPSTASASGDTGVVNTPNDRAVFAAAHSRATGSRSVVAASGGTDAADAGNEATGGQSALVACANGNLADQAGSMVLASRRTINSVARSVALGNANSGNRSTANRKIHLYSESGNVEIAGTLTSSHTFSDYGEYFENLTSGPIPLGAQVVLDGDRVRPATAADEPADLLGVVSATAGIALGDTPFAWQGRYLTGDFGERLYEMVPDEDWEGEGDPPMVAALIENPTWDPGLPQIPRSQRPEEWTLVGMLGQVHVRVAEAVAPGRWLALDGTMLPPGERSRLRVMRVTKAYDEITGWGVALCLLR